MDQQVRPQHSAQDRGGPVHWELDLRTGLLRGDPRRVELLGVPPDPAQAYADWWNTRIHPDDLRAVQRARARHFYGDDSGYRSEYRSRHQDKGWTWLLEIGAIVERDAEGEPLRACGVLLDVSSDKEAQFHAQQRLDRLRMLFDYTYQFVGLLTPDGVLVETNNTSLKSANVAIQEVVGRPFWETSFWHGQPPQQINLLRSAIACAARGEPGRLEQRLARADGSLRYLDVTLQPIFNDAGRVIWIVSEGHDVTAIMAVQQHLHTLQERLTIVTEGANLGLWDADLSANSLWCNDTWWTMLGYQPGELTLEGVQGWHQLLHPDDRSRVEEALSSRVITGVAGEINLEFRMRCRDGSWRWIHSFGHTVEHDTSGRPRRITGVHQDVTERREAALRLAAAERLESVGKLAAGVAHEINTPIQFVSDSVYFIRDAVAELLGLIRALRELLPADEAMAARAAQLMQDVPYLVEHLPRAVERSLEGLGRVAEIVRSMKEFAHPGQAQMAQMAQTDLNRAIQSTLVVARAEYKHVAEIDTRLTALPPVRCRAGEINQVLLNLIVNAAHAIGDGQQPADQKGRITISTQQDGATVVISIADTGCGIPEGIRHRIFEPFFTTKEVGRGTGQGLAIAHGIVKSHGGSITFQTEPGRGSTFYLKLPIDGPQPAAQQEQAA